MIGLLIVTHSNLGREIINAAEFIVGRVEVADTVSITETTDSEGIHKRIQKKVKALDRGQGVLILTDMFGGTPSNLSFSFLKEGAVDVLTGVNLPMVVEVAQNRQRLNLSELGEKAKEAGTRGIALGGKLLKSQ